jgi:hypothetical protein
MALSCKRHDALPVEKIEDIDHPKASRFAQRITKIGSKGGRGRVSGAAIEEGGAAKRRIPPRHPPFLVTCLRCSASGGELASPRASSFKIDVRDGDCPDLAKINR